MKQSIDIQGVPYYFEAIDLDAANAPSISFEDAKGILMKAREIFTELGIDFSLTFGTLLGAVREHSFISHDYDVDIMVFDYADFLSKIPEIGKRGLKLCRVVTDRLFSFQLNGCYIDIYIVKKAPSVLGWFCKMIGSDVIWNKYLRSFETIDFLGAQFNVPSHPEKILQFWYGKSWRTPIKGYTGNPDIYPVYLYRKFIKPIIKRNK